MPFSVFRLVVVTLVYFTNDTTKKINKNTQQVKRYEQNLSIDYLKDMSTFHGSIDLPISIALMQGKPNT